MKRLFCVLAAAAALANGQDKAGVPAPVSQGNPMNVNIELTVYVLTGLSQPPAGAKDEVPQDLVGMLQQLHNVFMYKNYKLLDEFELRSRNFAGAEVGGELPYFAGGQYDFKYRAARAATSTSRVVHIDGLRLEITRHSALNTVPTTVALVQTDLDVTEGQKTVVGKSAVNGSDALFLVVVPKIIE
jgi:hypothetical protein